jgi:DNA-binding transcriptional LysR family regulator
MQGANLLNVTRLRVLHELARRGTLAAVADALWMSPSAISQHLATLERETNTKLVEKAGRTVRLTAAGELLAEHAGRVMLALGEAEAALRTFEASPAGTLRIAAFPSVVRRLLAPALEQLIAAHPRLVVEVEDLEGQQGLEALLLARVDVAIIDDAGWDAAVRPGTVEIAELLQDQLVLALPEDHDLAGAAAVSWDDLRDRPLVVEQRSSLFSGTVASACRAAGFEPLVRARSHDVTAMLSLVRSAGLLCVLPELAEQPADGIIWRPLDPTVHRRLLAAVRRGHLERPTVQALIMLLRPSPPRHAEGVR